MEARMIAKAWKDEAYKQELLANPKAVFEQEFGVELPEQVSVQVLEENATTLNFVLPMRPQVGSELSSEDLEAIAGGGSTTARIATSMMGIGGNLIISALSGGIYDDA
ncbi:MAG: NHLP leader peptide family RiPP precursor [Cyanobacteria bacterium P01_A01_bin.83]